MDINAYEALRKHLDKFPTGFPKSEGNIEIAILKKFFSEEEAEIAVHLPLLMAGLPKNVQTIAAEMQKDETALENILNAMVHEGLISAVGEGKTKGYMLLPFIPGFLEYKADELDAETAQLVEDYLNIIYGEWSKTPASLTKVFPINRSISPNATVHPYEDVIKAIESSTNICLMPCVCRTQKKLIGEACGKPINTCMYLNDYANHLLGIGKGRKLTKPEAMDILTEAEQAGLVHISTNTRGLGAICSCCGCCCLALRGITQLKAPQALAKSDFKLVVDSDLCVGCEECIDRCWTKSLSMQDEKVSVDRQRCIGCGACAYVCPTEALRLERKSEKEMTPTPKDYPELLSKMGWR